MSKQDDQKLRHEQAHFEAFRQLLSEISDVEAQRRPPPAPDFIVSLGARIVGVELTSITTSRREVEALRDLAVSYGEAEYRRRGGPEAVASFHWSEAGIGRHGSSRELGLKLVNLVERHMPPEIGMRTELEWLERNRSTAGDLS